MARQCFEQALRIETRLPLAHYRLGHLASKERDWGEVVYHFTRALEQNERETSWQEVSLDEVQCLTAKKWISFCSWQLLKNYGTSHAISHRAYPELDQSLEDFLSLIEQEGVYKKVDAAGNVSLLSYEDYEDLLDESDFLIIDRIGDQAQLHYQGRSLDLNIVQVNLLKALFRVDAQALEWDVFPQAFSERSVASNRKYIKRLAHMCSEHLHLTEAEFGLTYKEQEGRQLACFNPTSPCLYITRRNE